MHRYNPGIRLVACCWTAGYLLAHYRWVSQNAAIFLLTLGALLYIREYFSPPRIRHNATHALILFLTGSSVLCYQLRLEASRPSHFSHFLTSPPRFCTLEISQRLLPSPWHSRYYANVTQMSSHSTSGLILLELPLQTFPLSEGTLLQVSGFPKLVSTSHTGDFDYRKYLRMRGITHRIKAGSKEIMVLDSLGGSLKSRIKNHLWQRILTNFKSPEVRSLMSSLFLGDRTQMPIEMKETFTKAGVAHILAISGMHVGFLTLLILPLLYPIRRLPFGDHIATGLLLLFLWYFAWFTGLSPSVTRAVTMCSFGAIGLQMGNKQGVINGMLVSYVLLLVWRPSSLFDAGFQLSYAAVTGILMGMPLCLRLWNPQRIVFKYPWNVLCITLSAQAGVLPLSLYYFGAFQGVFLLSNLIVVPLLSLWIGGGLFLLILVSLEAAPALFLRWYESGILWVTNLLTHLSQWKSFQFTDIYFDSYRVIASYLLLWVIWYFITSFTYQRLRRTIAVTGILSLYLWGTAYVNSISVKNEISPSSSSSQNTSLKPLKDGTWLLRIDTLPVYPENFHEPVHIWIQHQSKVNLDRLLSELEVLSVTADKTSSQRYHALWRRRCKSQKIPFHSLAERGSPVNVAN